MNISQISKSSSNFSDCWKSQNIEIRPKIYGQEENFTQIVPNERGQFSCCYCEDKLISRSGWNLHMKRHVGQYEFFCVMCKKGFMKRNDYEGHMNVHMNLKPYECDNCAKSFAYKQSLLHHRKKCLLWWNRPIHWKKNNKPGYSSVKNNLYILASDFFFLLNMIFQAASPLDRPSNVELESL